MAGGFTGSANRGVRVVGAALGAVVVIHMLEGLRFRSRRVRRRATGWFDLVERRERAELFDAEVDALAKLLARFASAAR